MFVNLIKYYHLESIIWALFQKSLPEIFPLLLLRNVWTIDFSSASWAEINNGFEWVQNSVRKFVNIVATVLYFY